MLDSIKSEQLTRPFEVLVFTKMTQNGLKWILNTTLKTVEKFTLFVRLPFILLYLESQYYLESDNNGQYLDWRFMTFIPYIID